MNELRNTLLIFFWGVPFFFVLGKLSFFYNDEFLGVWILSLREYPLSYSIFFCIVFSCAAIFSWILGTIKSYKKLSYILLGIFLGSIINICFVGSGLIKPLYSIFFVFALYFTVILQGILNLIGIILPAKLLENIVITTLITFLAIALLFLFNLLPKKTSEIKEKILLAILILSLPFFPIVIAPLVGSFIGDKLSSENRKKLSSVKRVLLGIPKLALIIVCFVWMIKFYHIPGLIISPNIRTILATNYYDNLFVNANSRYNAAVEKLSNCQLVKNEIGEIKNITLFEGNNYHTSDVVGDSEGSYLHIQIIGENKQAFVKGCFKAGSPGACFFAHNDIKLEDQNKAKIFSETGVKTRDISECL